MAHDPRTFVEISKTRELQKLTQEKKPVRLSQTRGRGVKMTPQRKIPFSFFFRLWYENVGELCSTEKIFQILALDPRIFVEYSKNVGVI